MKQIADLKLKPAFLVVCTLFFIMPLVFFHCTKDKLPVNGDPEKFTYLTEDYAPFNYSEDGKLTGIAVDILDSLFTRLDLSINRSAIGISEWATAYDKVLSTPRTMLFSMVKTSERTGLFKWVGPIATQTDIAVSLSQSGFELNEVTDLNNYFTGVVEGSGSVEILMNHGVLRANIIIYSNMADLYKALVVNKEVQFISTAQANHKKTFPALGYSSAEFAVPFAIHSEDLYYAFNIETADEMIADFQNQLNHFKSDITDDGITEYAKILSRYFL